MLRMITAAALLAVALAQVPALAPGSSMPAASSYPFNPSASKNFTDAQVIIDINNLAQTAVREESIQNEIASGKVYALVHLAALNAIDPMATPAVQQAEAAYAAVAALDGLFPWRFATNEQPLISMYTMGLTDAERSAAQAKGTAAANALLAESGNDGFNVYPTWFVGFNETTAQPGDYIFTPNQTYYLFPQLARAMPLLIENTSRFDTSLAQPYTLGSAEWTAALQEVSSLGADNSVTRPANGTQTADFWANGANTSTITGHWNTIAQIVIPADISLLDAATLFAQINAAVWDASIAGWGQKYGVLFWRPITAIRSNYTRDNNAALYNPNWKPYLDTPASPEYPSGHSWSSGAAAGILANYLGTDNVTFTVGTQFPGLPPRTFNSLSEAVEDVNDSRVWGGLHFRKAVDDGAALGRKVADYVYQEWETLSQGGATSAVSG